MKPLLAAAGGALCAVGLYFVLSSATATLPSRTTHKPVAEASQAPPAVPQGTAENAQVNQLSRELLALRAELAEVKAASQPVAAASATEPVPEMPDLEARARKREERRIQLEADFEAEPRNPRWAADAASQLQDALAAKASLQANFRNLECRSQTCRLELINTGPDFDRSLTEFTHQLGDKLPNVRASSLSQRNGTKITTLYMQAGS